MTERNPPYVIQSRADHPADLFRMALRSVTGSSEGIVDSTDLAVSQRGAGANMSVDVSSGNVMVRGDEAAAQGTYHCYNDATVNVTIAAAHPSLARWDLVVAKVADSSYSGGDNAWSIAVVQGTPAASPADPAVPNNAVVLARVVVGAGVTSITNANIADLRPRLTGAGGITPANSARRPGATYSAGTPYAGKMTYDTDTNQLMVYNGSAWVTVSPVAQRKPGNSNRASTSFGDLNDGAGPSVTLQTGSNVLISMHAWSACLVTEKGQIAPAVTGASNISASEDNSAIQHLYSDGMYTSIARTFLMQGLTAGSNTFTLKYKSYGNSVNFVYRDICVTGLPW